MFGSIFIDNERIVQSMFGAIVNRNMTEPTEARPSTKKKKKKKEDDDSGRAAQETRPTWRKRKEKGGKEWERERMRQEEAESRPSVPVVALSQRRAASRSCSLCLVCLCESVSSETKGNDRQSGLLPSMSSLSVGQLVRLSASGQLFFRICTLSVSAHFSWSVWSPLSFFYFSNNRDLPSSPLPLMNTLIVFVLLQSSLRSQHHQQH